MKRLLTATTALAFCAGAAFAQTTTQQSVQGSSGNAEFPLEVLGGNGVIYACKNEIVTVDGVRARQCIRAGAGGGLLGAGTGLATGAAVGVGALVLVAVAGNSGSSTATTSGS